MNRQFKPRRRFTCLICLTGVALLGVGTDAIAQSGSKPARQKPGIVGQAAPSWKTSAWHQLPDGKKRLDVGDYKGKVLYLYFFQSWCPGCHRVGFPTLQKVSKALKDNEKVQFVAIQTTFEGHNVNTAEKLIELAKRYKLTIPFGQSAGSKGTPEIMRKYRTGGTPWVVIIDTNGRVVFNDFHIDADRAIAGIRSLSSKPTKIGS